MASGTFAEAVEMVGRLAEEEQAALVGLIQRRLAEAGRRRVVADVQDANAEFAAGGCRPATPEDILRDALS